MYKQGVPCQTTLSKVSLLIPPKISLKETELRLLPRALISTRPFARSRRRAFLPGQPMTDEALVRRFQSGDEAAFDELVERHRARIYGLVCRLVGPGEADD